MAEILNIDRETLRQLQLKELESLLFFKDFCEKNELRWYLLGGCVIGAVRHKGFIPWDDDIDIIMPRPDWERMLKLWKEQVDSKRFLMLKTDEGEIFTGNIFATLVDTSATMVKENQKDIDVPHGIVTDIFPIDGCPDSKFQRYMQFFWTLIYSLFISEFVPEKHGGIIAFGSKVLLSVFRSRKTRTKIWKFAEKQLKKYDFETHEFSTELYAGPYYMKKKYPQKAFAKETYLEFENMMLPVMQGYEEYLSIAFDDYMELPPVEKQVPHHDLVELDLSKPCV